MEKYIPHRHKKMGAKLIAPTLVIMLSALN